MDIKEQIDKQRTMFTMCMHGKIILAGTHCVNPVTNRCEPFRPSVTDSLYGHYIYFEKTGDKYLKETPA